MFVYVLGCEVDGELMFPQSSVELFECAICNQSVPSTEQEPVGFVAFLQSGTGKHLQCAGRVWWYKLLRCRKLRIFLETGIIFSFTGMLIL